MMQHHPALTCWRRFSNRRGAVLLLTVYFTSLVLLILGGISLQRTMIESRAAQVSRDTQQAFYLAEGAVDYAVTRLEGLGLPDGTYTREQLPTLPEGASFTLTTTLAELTDPDTQQLSRTVVGHGITASGASAQVNITLSQAGPIQGVWSEGPIWVWGGSFGSGDINGDLRSALGTKSAIKFTWRVKQRNGDVQIAPSAPLTQAQRDIFLSTFPGDLDNDGIPWAKKSGQVWDEHPGVYLPGLDNQSNPQSIAGGEPIVAPMEPGNPIAPDMIPYPAASCTGNLTLTSAAATMEIGDGHPLDLSGPGDGKIALCLEYIFADSPGSSDPAIIFRGPTTIYLTGRHLANNTYYALHATEMYAVAPGNQPPQVAPLAPLQIVVTQAPAAWGVDNNPLWAGKIHLGAPKFSGSIYAPESRVHFFPRAGESTYQLQHIVARTAAIFSGGIPISLGQQTPEGSGENNQKTNVVLTSWTSQ